MKAKTLMGMIACAGACVSLSAFGNTTNYWFDVTASGSSVSTSAGTTATTNNVAVTVAEDGKLVLDNDSSNPLVVATTASSSLSDNVVKISGVALLTPSSTNDFEVTTDAKAGFAVGIDDNSATNFYGYANGEWHKLSGDASNADTQNTSFSLVLDYRVPNVRFYVGDTLLTDADTQETSAFDLASGATGFTAIDAFGSGSITSITGSYEVAVCAIANEKKYGSVSDAITAGGTTGTIQYINNSGTPVGVTAANGLDAATCIALGVDPTSDSAVVRFVPADSDTDAEKVTLKVNSDNVDTALYVTYSVSDGTTTMKQKSSNGTVKIPTTTGVYTITPTSVSTTEN